MMSLSNQNDSKAGGRGGVADLKVAVLWQRHQDTVSSGSWDSLTTLMECSAEPGPEAWPEGPRVLSQGLNNCCASK